MTGVAIGGNPLSECPKCAGLWADSESLRQICADREKQAAVLGIPTTDGNGGAVALEQIRYLPCPDCGKLMNRVNFSGYSGVIVDVCREHGTWFDRDELRRVVEFIRAGGLDKARAREVANLEEGRRLAHLDLPVPAGTVDLRGHALWSLSDFLLSFLK
jgi:Zn-finger nucleic acid-binding protein